MSRAVLASVPCNPLGRPVDDRVVTVGTERWRRIVLRTPWLSETDDLGAVLAAALEGVPGAGAEPRAVVAFAEKVAVVTSGRTVPGGHLRAGWLARRLARSIRPVDDSLGLSVPEKMQYVLERAGVRRVLAGAVAAAGSRLVRRPGVFFRVVGPIARDLDGMRGAYPSTLLPPLERGEADVLAHHLAVRLRRVVAIVDINDRGGTIRAVSAGGPPPDLLLAVLADNPLGHCSQSTPVVLLIPLP